MRNPASMLALSAVVLLAASPAAANLVQPATSVVAVSSPPAATACDLSDSIVALAATTFIEALTDAAAAVTRQQSAKGTASGPR
ncbi:hypothetical protein [Phenylobacterium sp.]|uniref:hypothetical protein n=1 Tax=Phenylobacterium sp. TaxID=1871053 RepID=UPI00273547F4|nr:hypothetical protein [Phenylobacterium sp.]MDP3660535.1 hypothetical protein [Phenylobacterium sp.]